MRRFFAILARRSIVGMEILTEIVAALYHGRELAIAWRDAETLSAILNLLF